MSWLPNTLLSLLLLVTHRFLIVASFEWQTTGRPPVDRRAIAGLWRLTSTPSPTFPKEFTVHPKPPAPQPPSESDDLLLMLKEDGSFQQYKNEQEEMDIDDSWNRFHRLQQQKQDADASDQLHHHFLHGTWDYRDGRLILAADRKDVPTQSDDVRKSSVSSQTPSSSSSPSASFSNDRVPRSTTDNNSNDPQKKKPIDTLLTGKVVAKYETKLADNPALKDETDSTKQNEVASDDTATSHHNKQPDARSDVDAHLSVPKGSVKVGRFFYPKNHPSFFDQPMFQPKKQGTVTLRQVLGNLNTAGRATQDDEYPEKFQYSDFYNKTFLLTSHPLGYRVPKGRERWSIRQNKWVHDPPSKEAQKAADQAANAPSNIRVLQIQFHANNTFSTVAGLGETILRGKFHVFGTEKDQFWMQVSRFGFGRSVSGSVYSEGKSLTQNDAKSYWGTIHCENTTKEQNNVTAADGDNTTTAATTATSLANEPEKTRLEVTGSVLIGVGVEPTPEARFIMRELSAEDTLLEDDEEDEDDYELDIASLQNISLNDDTSQPWGDDGIDYTDDDTSFQ